MTARPRRDVLDGTITDPDRARRVMVTDAHLLVDRDDLPPAAAELAVLVLWMNLHLLRGGAWPTPWASADNKARPVTDVRAAAPAGVTVELVYRESWRAGIWDPDVPSREGWQVQCSEHGLLRDGYAYAGKSHAKATATRHRKKHAKTAPTSTSVASPGLTEILCLAADCTINGPTEWLADQGMRLGEMVTAKAGDLERAEAAARWLDANRDTLDGALADAAEYRDPQGECADDLNIPGTGERLCDDHAEDAEFITVYDRLRAELKAILP